MERHNLFGLIEILFVLGLLLWFAFTQIRFPGKGERSRGVEGKAAESKDEPPREH
jgi:hypothetical protein